MEDDLNPLRIALMKHFNWNRVATLVYNDDIFTSQIDELHQQLIHKENNLTLITSGIMTNMNNISDHITRLKQYDTRIIIGAFRIVVAREVFCEVYKQGLYGRRYTWILTGTSLYRNWIKDTKDEDLRCPRSHMYAAANYMITLDQSPLSTDNITTLSGRTSAEYDVWVSNLYTQANDNTISVTRNHPWIYDAVWALAVGLNNSLNHLNGSRLEDFDYSRSDITNSILTGMDEVLFNGVSGQVSFQNGRRVGPAFIQTNIGDDRTDVGRFDPLTGEITWFVEPSSLWPGNRIPRDGSRTMTESVQTSLSAVIIMGLLGTVGLIGSIGILIFNIIYRHNRHIKMSSPRINNMIICGGILMYISVYVSIMEYVDIVSDGSLCMLGAWCTALGFTTAFGALFSKTWRVHVLFHNNNIKKKIIKDAQLFAVCGVLLALDLIILVPWTLFYRLDKKKIVKMIDNEDLDVTYYEVYHVCGSETKIYWLGVQYIYKGLLLAFGTFLAWETRKIEVPALNDSKLIGFCVYNVVIVCIIGVPIHHVLREEQITARFVLMDCFVIFCTTLVLCILFIPKLKLRNSTESVKFVPSLMTKSSPSHGDTNVSKTGKNDKAVLHDRLESQNGTNGHANQNGLAPPPTLTVVKSLTEESSV